MNKSIIVVRNVYIDMPLLNRVIRKGCVQELVRFLQLLISGPRTKKMFENRCSRRAYTLYTEKLQLWVQPRVQLLHRAAPCFYLYVEILKKL